MPTTHRHIAHLTDPPSTLRILVVEDHPVNQMVVDEMLQELGYSVDRIANDGVEALEAVESEDFDVIIMDVQMPRMDGLEATRLIKQRLAARCPYIIALTAHCLPTDRRRCFEAGMDCFLSKPVGLDDLRQALTGKGDCRRSQGQISTETFPTPRRTVSA